MRSELFREAVAQAARKGGRHRPKLPSDGSLEALAAAREADPMRGVREARQAARCGATCKRTGRPCRQPAVRGATRCRMHGGLREAPEHPANLRRYWNGRLDRGLAMAAARKRWREAWAALTIEQRMTVAAVLPAGARAADRGRGALALLVLEQDGGRAWRKWMQARGAH